MQVKGQLTEMLVELTSGEKILVVQIEIDCEGCGRTLRYVVPGHHLKMVRDMLTDAIEAHADLPTGTIKAGGRTTVVIPGGPKDPTQN